MSARLRPAQAGDCDRLAVIWHQAWHDGHAARMPEKLVKLRTLPDFRRRIVPMLEATVVGESEGVPAGFCTIDGDEIAHLFLDREARGSGLAALLLADAEARLGADGIETAWLSCAIGNMRAARFYERRGWQRRGSALYQAETSEGVFPIEEWRYEKRVSSG